MHRREGTNDQHGPALPGICPPCEHQVFVSRIVSWYKLKYNFSS